MIFSFKLGQNCSQNTPIKTHSEALYSLRKSLSVHTRILCNIDINGNGYRNNKFIVGVDAETFWGLSFTRINTRNKLVTVHLTSQTNDYKADCARIILLAG